MHDLHIISWNITRRCNLECSHCYLPATARKDHPDPKSSKDLTTAEALRLIDQIALVNPEVMLILSGGEPLLRKDLFEISAYASRKGMMVVVGSNGTFIDYEVARLLKHNGVSGISISLDSAQPEIHDAMRARPGAWERAVSAIESCKRAGLSVQINTVVTQKNYDEIPVLIESSRSLGATVYSPFFLVCTGRGEELTDISPQQYERILSFIAESQARSKDVMIRTRCAPTIRRIIYKKNPGSRLLKMGTGRCLAGLSYCRITPEGDVTPCPYMPLSAGNVREREFSDIWKDSAIFKSLRRPELKGKCRECEFRLLCGGCRARAYAKYADYLGEDPWCDYIPQGDTMIKSPVLGEDMNTEKRRDPAPLWTAEAEERLKRVPSFVRNMVRMSIERYAMEHNVREITPVLMEEVKQKSGMGGMHGHP